MRAQLSPTRTACSQKFCTVQTHCDRERERDLLGNQSAASEAVREGLAYLSREQQRRVARVPIETKRERERDAAIIERKGGGLHLSPSLATQTRHERERELVYGARVREREARKQKEKKKETKCLC